MSSGWSIDCADIHTLAAAWLDEQLSPAEQELFETHLESCAACQKFIERLSLQTIAPPVIELSRAHDYWQQMDAALVDELDRLEQEQQVVNATGVTPHRATVFALVAVLMLSFLWGISEHRRAVSLEQQVLHQAQTIEHYERLSAQPSKSSTPPRARSSKRYVPARLDL